MSTHFVNLLDDLRRQSLRMASQVEDMLHEACETINEANRSVALRVIARDEEVDAAEIEVESEVIRLLALYQPVGIDLRTLCTILKINSDLERIADCAVNIAERGKHAKVQAPARDSAELREMHPIVRQVLRSAVQAYAASDLELARQVRAQDDAVDALYGQIVRSVIAGASDRTADLAGWLDLLSVAKNLERIADHAVNIAEDVIFLLTGQIVRHDHAPAPPPADGA
ncbi:MAG: phosphate signaling complex protein PhoU [Planctomycetota bacterium]